MSSFLGSSSPLFYKCAVSLLPVLWGAPAADGFSLSVCLKMPLTHAHSREARPLGVQFQAGTRCFHCWKYATLGAPTAALKGSTSLWTLGLSWFSVHFSGSPWPASSQLQYRHFPLLGLWLKVSSLPSLTLSHPFHPFHCLCCIPPISSNLFTNAFFRCGPRELSPSAATF